MIISSGTISSETISSEILSSEIVSPDFQVSLADLCTTANISTDYIIELIEYDIIMPISGTEPHEWQFTISAMIVVNKAARLHRDLDIEWADIALVLNLLEEIDELKNENRQLKQQINRLSAVNH